MIRTTDAPQRWRQMRPVVIMLTLILLLGGLLMGCFSQLGDTRATSSSTMVATEQPVQSEPRPLSSLRPTASATSTPEAEEKATADVPSSAPAASSDSTSETASPDAEIPSPPVAEPTSPQPEAMPLAAPPQRLTIPAAGLEVAVGEIPGSNHIDPPTFDMAYWVSRYGQPGRDSTDSVYIVGHSMEGGGWQLNKLSYGVDVGDEVQLQTANGTVKYVVDNVFVTPKPTLGESAIWAPNPGHLYLISSYEGNIWNDNIVVSATPVQ